MKNLAEKFDHLPQDFDREAIWRGIEKPRRRFFFPLYFWGALLLVATGVLYFVLAANQAPETPTVRLGSFRVAVSSGEEVASAMGAAAPDLDLIAASRKKARKFPTPFDPNDSTKEKTARLDQEMPEHEAVSVADQTPPAARRSRPTPLRPISARPDTEFRGMAVSLLPQRSFPLPLELDNPSFDSSVETGFKRKRARQRLAIRAGIGVHRTDFSSADGEESSWRAQLEKPQLGYSLGLRYERIFGHNFLLSGSALYQLYKDQINTTYVRQAPAQDTLVNYRLFNHYHVFSGQVALGRRFYQEGFFWDIQGGLGLTFHQSAQTDYFVGEGELADAGQVARDYPNKTDLFFSGQAAIGKQLSPRLNVRLGTQINSRKVLTAPEATVRHRIFPVDAFLEIGIRL